MSEENEINSKSAYEPSDDPQILFYDEEEEERQAKIRQKQEAKQQKKHNVQEKSEDERDYFEVEEEKINNTKAKLQNLLEKLQAKPPKETISKKLLRLRINRLRTYLNRSMEKFNIEYQADLEEHEKYAQFSQEYAEMYSQMEELEDKEADLEWQLESYERKANYRGSKSEMDSQIKRLAPKNSIKQFAQPKDVKTKDVKNAPKNNREYELKRQLDNTRLRIEFLQEQINEKIEDYSNYKDGLETQTQQKVADRMEELKVEEAMKKKQQKENLAMIKPSLWQKVKNKVKETVGRINRWNQDRKEKNQKVTATRDEMATKDVEELLSQPTPREEFMKKMQEGVNPPMQGMEQEENFDASDINKVISEVQAKKKEELEEQSDSKEEDISNQDTSKENDDSQR